MNKKTIALMQALILVIGIIAIGYAVGSSVGEVSGVDYDCLNKCEGKIFMYDGEYDSEAGTCKYLDIQCLKTCDPIKGCTDCFTNDDCGDNQICKDGKCIEKETTGESATGLSKKDDSQCTAKTGVCKDISEKCTNGKFEPGLCSGTINRQCCVPTTKERTEEAKQKPSITTIFGTIMSILTTPTALLQAKKALIELTGKDKIGGKTLEEIKYMDESTFKVFEEQLSAEDKAILETLSKDAPGWFEKNIAGKVGGQQNAGIWKRLGHGAIAASGAEIFGHLLKWTVFAASSEMNKRGIETTIHISAAAAGAIVGIFGTSLPGFLGGMAVTFMGTLGLGAIAAAIAIAIYMLTSYKIYMQEKFQATVLPWKAELGGAKCDLCNKQEYGCFEYQCKSLGQGCEIINPGSEQEKCYWKNPNEKNPPTIIQLLNDKLPGSDYHYVNLSSTSPTGKGAKVVYDGRPDGCIKAFSDISFGFKTDEPAECKIDLKNLKNYTDMEGCVNEGCYLIEEHSITIPHILTGSGYAFEQLKLSLENDNQYNFYVRCRDANGNTETTNFVFQFCIDNGPDTTAPKILGTTPLDGAHITYNKTSIPFEVYTDEPAECKWDFEDRDYEVMLYNFSTCAKSFGQFIFLTFNYGCRGTVDGLKDREKNKIYIRCMDKPDLSASNTEEVRIVNKESKIVKLIGTEPLLIKTVTINGKENGSTIKDSTEPIKIKLEAEAYAGAEQGKSICSYSKNGITYFDFYNEGSSQYVVKNTQNLYLIGGTYNYYIKCSDIAGNSDTTLINFIVEQDRTPPTIVRVYYDIDKLNIISDEESECVYNTNSNVGCSYAFSDGTVMKSTGKLTHYTLWESNKKYYIKCKDKFGNLPLPGECSIIVRAFDVVNNL